MPRFTDASLISALESDSFSYATLISLGTQSSLIRITDNDKDVTLNADTYTSTTTLLDYGEAQETSDVSVGGMDITFSGVNQTMVSYMLSNDYIGLPVDIKRCALSDSNVVIGSFTYFKGQVSGFEIVDTNDKSEVLVNCKSHWADFEKLNGRRTNHNSQQLHFSGDLGFEFAAKTIKDIRWGKA
jgi:hypothetical protein